MLLAQPTMSVLHFIDHPACYTGQARVSRVTWLEIRHLRAFFTQIIHCVECVKVQHDCAKNMHDGSGTVGLGRE